MTQAAAAVLLMVAVTLAAAPVVTAKENFYCTGSSRQIRPSSTQLQLEMTVNSSLMSCEMQVLPPHSNAGYYVIRLATVSMSIPASFQLFSGFTSGEFVAGVKSSNSSLYREFATGDSFTAKLQLSSTPYWSSHVLLEVEFVNAGSCPDGWYAHSSYCYGTPKLNDKATFSDAIVGCHRMRANLAMKFSSYSSAHFTEAVSGTPYYVGVKEYKSKMYFLDGSSFFKSASSIDYSSTGSSYCPGTCKCVYYRSHQFYRQSCSSRMPYLCYAEVGGATQFYTEASMTNAVDERNTGLNSYMWVILLVTAVPAALAAYGMRRLVWRRGCNRQPQSRNSAAAVTVAPGVQVGAPISVQQQSPYPMQQPPYQQQLSGPQYPPPGAQPPPYAFSNAGFQAEATAPPSYESATAGAKADAQQPQ